MIKNKMLIIVLMGAGVALSFFSPEGVPFSVLSMLVGLVIVVLIGEPMVEGLREFSVQTGLSAHVTGIISSLASNLPEGVMTGFMILSPA